MIILNDGTRWIHGGSGYGSGWASILFKGFHKGQNQVYAHTSEPIE